ncbi:unnamed protein product [Spirodela intermedia]|uniref:Thioredoxin domain-containing protein n=1 Tax=Spirodela intermedia TaxID=51605 RepID=A0A7I8J714_SPIIN|nr:unnamed protein product [Spirodela intermedia]CAA6665849.1 unnamed protein product [Spirodela intermedia]
MNGKKPRAILGSGLDSISDRFHSAITTFDGNKPDSKDFDLGSPVSPLGNRPTSTAITNTSSSSSSSGSVTGRTGSNTVARKKYDGKSHSGELGGSGESHPAAVDSPVSLGQRNWKPGHRRSGSGHSATSPITNVLPTGNICPSGKLGKTGMMSRSTPRSDVLGSGTGNYGHGSIMRGGAGPGGRRPECSPSTGSPEMAAATAVRRAMASTDPEEVKKAGNEQYKMGHFSDALKLYNRAISMCPANATCHSNRAAALIGLGRLADAVRECEEAVKLDPSYWRAHQRLASLYIRLGQVESAQKHIYAGQQLDQVELQKVQAVERHLKRCADVRKIKDWASVLRESEAAIEAGADSSSLEADSILAKASKLEFSLTGASQTSFFGMQSNAYLFFVQALVEMALGRFENAVSAAEKAARADPRSSEVATVLANVRAVARARSRGNELFKAGMFVEACGAYGEGLRFDPSNPVLYCNRAACLSKLGQWEKSVQDCNEALRIHPNYAKALLRRAASNGKLERWAEAVRDYELLRKQLPGTTRSLKLCFQSEVRGEVEKISGVEHFRAAISLPGVSVVHFMSGLNQQCLQISPFVDSLCTRYPSVNFLKVDVDESPDVASSESVRIVPTFKIYKQGSRVKEMICPSRQVLEYSVRHYGI